MLQVNVPPVLWQGLFHYNLPSIDMPKSNLITRSNLISLHLSIVISNQFVLILENNFLQTIFQFK